MVVWNDLRDWLAEVEKIGELARINEPTDWDEEISGITYLTGKKLGGPALLFDNIQGYPQGFRVLSNILGLESQQDRPVPGSAAQHLRPRHDKGDKKYL